MTRPLIAQYQYTLPKKYITNSQGLGPRFWWLAIITTIISIVTIVGPLLCLIFFFFWGSAILGRNSRILVCNRYFIMGDIIIYYNNLVEVKLDVKQKVFQLMTKGGEKHRIEAKFFPTNARKSWKISRNRKAKFEKVTTKLITHIRSNAPQVPIGNGTV